MTTEYHQQPRSLSRAVITAVSEREGVEPAELPPLYRDIDPDAVDALFATERPRTEGRVVFSYHRYEIAVHSTGHAGLDAAGDHGPP